MENTDIYKNYYYVRIDLSIIGKTELELDFIFLSYLIPCFFVYFVYYPFFHFFSTYDK